MARKEKSVFLQLNPFKKTVREAAGRVFGSTGVLIYLGWGTAFLALLALLDFHPIVKLDWKPAPEIWPPWLVFLLLGCGLTAMTFGFRWTPARKVPDLDRATAWTLLGAIAAAGAFLRLYHYDLPPVGFWDDWADGIVWQNIVRDKDQFYWMFPTDGREPFLPYVMIALMEILPESTRDFVIKRLAGCSIDLTAIWLMYRAGKELDSRRAGLVAAALTAFSRPTLQLTLTGMRAFTLTLAVAFLVFATLRMLKKPKLSYFLLWGFALAFGVHTYSSFRTFMMAVPFLLLPWALLDPAKKGASPAGWAAALLSVLSLLGVYSGTLAATFPFFIVWRDRWDQWAADPWGIPALFLAALGCSLWALLAAQKKGASIRLPGWALATAFASALVYPISRSVGFTERLSGLSPFHQEGQAENPLFFLVRQAWATLQALFYHCLDRHDLKIAADPYFDLFTQGAVVLGLAFLLSRWDPRKILLLALAVLGTSVYILSFDPASTKLLACAPPLFLLSGWAVAHLFTFQRRPAPRSPRPLLSVILPAFLILYAGFGAVLQFQKLHGHWAQRGGVQTDTSLAKQVWVHEKDHRVYLAPAAWFFGWNSQCVLNQGKRYYILKESNAVPEPSAGKGEPIVIFVSGADPVTADKLRKAFPKAGWEKIPLNPYLAVHDPNPELYMWKVKVLMEEVATDPAGILFLKESQGEWLRRYYNPVYGWSLTGILREARVEWFDTALPVDELLSEKFRNFNYARLVHSSRVLEVSEGGRYEWRVRTSRPLYFKIDGKTCWKRDSPKQGDDVVFERALGKGLHRLEVKVRIGDDFIMPRLEYRRKGGGDWLRL